MWTFKLERLSKPLRYHKIAELNLMVTATAVQVKLGGNECGTRVHSLGFPETTLLVYFGLTALEPSMVSDDSLQMVTITER